MRALARATQLPSSTIGDYSSGRSFPLPTDMEKLRVLLIELGVTREADIKAWTDAALRARGPVGHQRRTASLPYRGLASFGVEDARWFHGREEATAELLAAVSEDQDLDVPVIVVGASGSGKTSLLHAGLLAALAGSLLTCTPGDSPLAELSAGIARATGRPALAPDLLRERPGAVADEVAGLGEAGLTVAVDQLEEIFTLCDDEEERSGFLSALAALAAVHTGSGGRVLVVLALRADFYGQALSYPVLAAALRGRQVVVRPMTTEELRRSVTGPAREASMEVDDGLVPLLLADLSPGGGNGAAHNPGALPLLSHALLTTAERSGGRRLTVADYLATGGIEHAIGNSAERVYGDLGESRQEAARRLFLRLVHLGQDTADTRRRARWAELTGSDGTVPPDVDEALTAFVAERLLTVDSTSVEITHEALLGGWPRLREWTEANRARMLQHRRLADSAFGWQEGGRDTGALSRGGRLALFRELAADATYGAVLSRLEHEFLDASAAQEERAHAADRLRVRRLRRLSAALVIALVAALALGGVAFRQRSQVNIERDQALSRQIAGRGELLRQQDVSLAAGLGVEAYRISPTTEARTLLLEASDTPSAVRLERARGVVQAVPVSSRHVLASAAADGTVRLWDVAGAGPRLLRLIKLPARTAVYAAAFTPDGRQLAAAGQDGEVRRWDVTDPARPVSLGSVAAGAGTLYALAYSPDGRTLAVGGQDGTVRRYQVGTPGTPVGLRPLTGPRKSVQSLAFAPDGRTLAAGSADGGTYLWRPGGSTAPVWASGAARTPEIVFSVCFSPDGTVLAAGSRDGSVRLRRIGPGGLPGPSLTPPTPATSWVNSLAFSPDGHLLAMGSSDSSARLWDMGTGQVSAVLPHPGPVAAVAWDSSQTLVTGAGDGAARLWHLPVPYLPGSGLVASVAYRPDGRVLAVGSGAVRLWDTARHRSLGAALAGPTPANAVAFSPDGDTLAVGYNDGSIRLWGVRDPSRPVPLGGPVQGGGGQVIETLAFRPGGGMLVSGGDDHTIRLWRLSPGRPLSRATELHGPQNYVFSVAFSPDGRTLAVGTRPRPRHLLPNPAGGVAPRRNRHARGAGGRRGPRRLQGGGPEAVRGRAAGGGGAATHDPRGPARGRRGVRQGGRRPSGPRTGQPGPQRRRRERVLRCRSGRPAADLPRAERQLVPS
ncbi:WD40 repeat [Actinacidiphila paucisporea]|uniref:WD40 repeat n=1 Tax=Actinacidiphila paucisporea TaxID=310782 RepID=A0A1M7QE42_9ACTN|nr:WD40 repeat [Actinacidiphila paucisporea]